MSWFGKFLTSSIGKKITMSLTGLFLILFLLVHLIGNLQLLIDDGGRQFNLYGEFMATNPIIKTTSIILYVAILLHAIQGWLLWRNNRLARGNQAYEVKRTRAAKTSAFASKNMGWLGTIIFIFLLIHLYQFWFPVKFGQLPEQVYDGVAVDNLFEPVKAAFTNLWFVLFYVISMAIVGYHLNHGFQSAFQTLGLNHKKIGPLIKFLGKAYSFLVPAGFALIPIWFFIKFGHMAALI